MSAKILKKLKKRIFKRSKNDNLTEEDKVFLSFVSQSHSLNLSDHFVQSFYDGFDFVKDHIDNF